MCYYIITCVKYIKFMYMYMWCMDDERKDM